MHDAHDAGALADRVRQALEAPDLDAYAELLDPNVTWGAPDERPGCRTRGQVLAWYARGRDRGVRATVTEVVAHGDALLVGLRVTGRPDDPQEGADRWQVLRVRNRRIVDIRGFDDRADAAARIGLPG